MTNIKDIITTEWEATEYLEYIRWHGEPRCPYCDSPRVTWYMERRNYRCNACNRSFSVRTGTMMEGSRLRLRKWARAIDVVTRDPNIRPARLSIILDIDFATAKKLIRRIKAFYKLP